MKISKIVGVIGFVFAGLSSNVGATNYSFTGNFSQDDDVQLFNFSVGATSTVTLRTWSYAGGTNAAGETILRGGFDPILALFNGSGQLIGQNDDGGSLAVLADTNGNHYDTFLQIAGLAAGNYTVAVMEYNNFAAGTTLAEGFTRDGQGNFTPSAMGNTNCPAGAFVDATSACRDNHWAFDILNVAEATQVGGTIPEPGSFALAALGLASLGALRRRKIHP